MAVAVGQVVHDEGRRLALLHRVLSASGSRPWVHACSLIYRVFNVLIGWMGEWMGGWMDGWVDGWLLDIMSVVSLWGCTFIGCDALEGEAEGHAQAHTQGNGA